MIEDFKLVATVWLDTESLEYAYAQGRLDATEGRERSFATVSRDEADAYRVGYQEGASIVAMLAGGDIDILPETLWADETTLNMPADLDFNAMLDAMREVSPVLTPNETSAYNWGWLAWTIGLVEDNLCEWARLGWQDAREQYEDARWAEREMFAQCVNPNWVAE